MSQVFFQDLELPRPDIYLGVGSGTHAEQTGRVMIEFEKVLLQERPDLVIVVGDVNSSLWVQQWSRKGIKKEPKIDHSDQEVDDEIL